MSRSPTSAKKKKSACPSRNWIAVIVSDGPRILHHQAAPRRVAAAADFGIGDGAEPRRAARTVR